jgi:transcriptional regulator with XRE-family HTH domain
MSKLAPISVHDLGGYLREQRQAAQLSLRQLSEVAGVSNPYLSQIERGLKRPSAEILQQLAKGLEVSAESLYVHAGILDERREHGAGAVDTRSAINADRRLSDRQKAALLDIYDSFVGAKGDAAAPKARKTTPKTAAPKTAAPKTATRKTAPRKTPLKGE